MVQTVQEVCRSVGESSVSPGVSAGVRYYETQRGEREERRLTLSGLVEPNTGQIHCIKSTPYIVNILFNNVHYFIIKIFYNALRYWCNANY